MLGLAVSAMVLAGHWGLWRCLRWRDLGVVLDRVHAELLARNELRGGLLRDVTGGRGLAGLLGAQAMGLVSRQQVG